MAKVTFSSRASCKMILHAAKYPHCAINGLLLAKIKNKSDNKTDLYIEDAIPLFHQSLHISPMSEIALTLIDQFAMQNGMAIAGYYFANELLNDMSTSKPAHKIADKIAENFSDALIAVIDNAEFIQGMTTIPLRIWQYIDEKWKIKDKDDIVYEGGDGLFNGVNILLNEEKYQHLIDFDNHLDNISLDWHNNELNKIIKKTITAQ